MVQLQAITVAHYSFLNPQIKYHKPDLYKAKYRQGLRHREHLRKLQCNVSGADGCTALLGFVFKNAENSLG